MRKRKLHPVTCQGCGKEFERRIDLIKKHGGVNYCSVICANKANAHKGLNISRSGRNARKGKMIKCLICEKEFYVPKWRMNTAKYCSKSCYGKSQIKN